MKNNKEKFDSINKSFREFMEEKIAEDRLKHLFDLEEQEVKFLNEMEFYNVNRKEYTKVEFLDVSFENNKYMITIYPNKSVGTVILKIGHMISRKIFNTIESQVILFEYIQNSGALAALQEISSKKIEQDGFKE